jgi:hypothetical protein
MKILFAPKATSVDTQCNAQKTEHCLKLSVNNMHSNRWPLIIRPSAEYSGYLILAQKGLVRSKVTPQTNGHDNNTACLYS